MLTANQTGGQPKGLQQLYRNSLGEVHFRSFQELDE